MNPPTENWQRARRPEQKQERERTIVAAAAELLDEMDLDQLSLTAIAKRAELSKGNLYRYFENREEIILHVVLHDVEEWTDALASDLTRLSGKGTPASVAACIADSLIARPRCAYLMAMIPGVLEQTVSEEAVLRFKRPLLTAMGGVLEALATAMPSMPDGSWERFFAQMGVVVAGIWPATHPSNATEAVLARPEFEGARVDYETTLRDILETLLRGLMTNSPHA